MTVYADIICELEKAKNERPPENIVTIFLFAGHGILKGGM